MRKYGYCRVSTKEQSLNRQIASVESYGVDKIITDKASGKDFNRDGYRHLKEDLLRSGDILVIKELDRLGRDMEQIKEEWNTLLKMGIDIVVIDTPILNTVNKGDLEKTLISNIVFELLSYMAEKERVKIKNRQREGIEAMPVDAKTGKKVSTKTGKVTGRPVAEYPSNWEAIYKSWKDGSIKGVEAMDKLGLKKTTFYKLVKQYEKN